MALIQDQPKKQLVKFYVGKRPIYAGEFGPMSPNEEPARYEDVIRITVTSSKNTTADLEASELHMSQFAQEWAQFQGTMEYRAFIAAKEEHVEDYTPLSHVTSSPSLIDNLGKLGIKSVEQLASAPVERIVNVKNAVPARVVALELVEARKPMREPVPEGKANIDLVAAAKGAQRDAKAAEAGTF